MPRPKKCRKVCCMPKNSRFGPLGGGCGLACTVVMHIDEYETIRLIDLEGMTQEECSEKMHIARTTVQGIYALARKKLADSLENGKVLLIEGGDYQLCNDKDLPCGGSGCRRLRQPAHTPLRNQEG